MTERELFDFSVRVAEKLGLPVPPAGDLAFAKMLDLILRLVEAGCPRDGEWYGSCFYCGESDSEPHSDDCPWAQAETVVNEIKALART